MLCTWCPNDILYFVRPISIYKIQEIRGSSLGVLNWISLYSYHDKGFITITGYTINKLRTMANIVVSSVICGIHRTKVGSNREVKLHVENDDSIPGNDPNCMVVKMPQIEDIPVELHCFHQLNILGHNLKLITSFWTPYNPTQPPVVSIGLLLHLMIFFADLCTTLSRLAGRLGG